MEILQDLPEEIKFEEEKLQLKHICRETIRKHLLKLDHHSNLFGRIPDLSLTALNKCLLFHVSLDDDDDDDDDDGYNYKLLIKVNHGHHKLR